MTVITAIPAWILVEQSMGQLSSSAKLPVISYFRAASASTAVSGHDLLVVDPRASIITLSVASEFIVSVTTIVRGLSAARRANEMV